MVAKDKELAAQGSPQWALGASASANWETHKPGPQQPLAGLSETQNHVPTSIHGGEGREESRSRATARGRMGSGGIQSSYRRQCEGNYTLNLKAQYLGSSLSLSAP